MVLSSLLRGLYAISPERSDTVRLLAEVEAAVKGGCRLVQYRCKRADRSLRLAQAGRMARYCRENGVCLIINDDVELALQCGADGVHLGGDDGDPAVARKLLGNGRILGVSCYNDPSRVRAAVSHGADYVALGAMFASTTKPDAVRASLALLSDISADCSVPVATIGGITLENAPALISSGADMVAVVSDLFEAPDIQVRARAFQNLFNTSIHSMRTA